MNPLEGIRLALLSLLDNKLRAFLTLLSVAIGVFAIFIAGSMVESIDHTIENQLNDLGENVFVIKRRPDGGFSPRSFRMWQRRPVINLEQATKLKEALIDDAIISAQGDDDEFVVSSPYFDSDPNVVIDGIDENYFTNYSTKILDGRALTESDLKYKRNVVIIGPDVQKKIYPFGNPIGQTLKIRNQKFEIVGILAEKGAVLGQSQDNRVLMPINIFLKYFSGRRESLNITINPKDKENSAKVYDLTIGKFREIRNLHPTAENNFHVQNNAALTEQFSGLRNTILIIGILVGTFTLIAAGIGIMNIMLITIKERTREIGVRKALGAKKSWILLQFVTETITICQLGGLFGIIVSLIIGFSISYFFDFYFGISLFWITISIVITTVLGLIFGLYPSMKAASLDPIEALRYE